MGVGKSKKRYHDNSVKGTRRGSKWPEETKTGAMCELLVSNNLSAVARKYGVPESTLRTWMAEARKLGPGERKSLFDAERERQLRALQHRAATGARLSVEYIGRRLEVGARDAEASEAIKARLDAMDGVSFTGEELTVACIPDEAKDEALRRQEQAMRDKLGAAGKRHQPMSDFAAANYARALATIAGRAGELLGEDQEEAALVVQVVLDDTAKELMG